MSQSPAARFKDLLRAREPLLGTFVKTPSPVVVEVLASTGLDVLVLDAEHAPFDRRDLDAGLMAARAGGIAALVRTGSAAPHDILNALDLGAAGVLVPHVRSGAQARAAVEAAHFGAGGRGYAGGTRSAGFAAPAIGERIARAQAETTVIVQVEDAEALPQVAAIAATPGVDAVFVGRIDLTVALGETDPLATSVISAVRDVLRATLAQDCACGMFTPALDEVADWRARGASLFLLGSDQGFIKSGAQALRRAAGF